MVGNRARAGLGTKSPCHAPPVGGLYLGGAATFPGAGVWGASGRNAAHVVLTDIG